VFAESALDALSYATLFPRATARYASIAGQPSPAQRELMRFAIAQMSVGSEIVAAMDSDLAGDDLATVVRRAVELSGRHDLRFRIHQPVGVKDWNDLLHGRAAASKDAVTGGPSLA